MEQRHRGVDGDDHREDRGGEEGQISGDAYLVMQAQLSEGDAHDDEEDREEDKTSEDFIAHGLSKSVEGNGGVDAKPTHEKTLYEIAARLPQPPCNAWQSDNIYSR